MQFPRSLASREGHVSPAHARASLKRLMPCLLKTAEVLCRAALEVAMLHENRRGLVLPAASARAPEHTTDLVLIPINPVHLIWRCQSHTKGTERERGYSTLPRPLDMFQVSLCDQLRCVFQIPAAKGRPWHSHSSLMWPEKSRSVKHVMKMQPGSQVSALKFSRNST